MAIIQVSNLKKTFGNNVVLNGINLDIEKKDVVAIIGPSGSGKSTLLRCLNLLEQPSARAAKSALLVPDFVGSRVANQPELAYKPKYEAMCRRCVPMETANRRKINGKQSTASIAEMGARSQPPI